MLKVKDGVNGNSTTATTLQNARTINGTNFDGSANITTSNWGTSRTLTVGNTGKSVNGSANISWTLAEIGAAKAYTSANGYEGITLSDGTTTNWLRTTSNGIIPYQSGGSGSLGTSSWPFNTVYAKTLYENGTALSSKYAVASHTHEKFKLKSSLAITSQTNDTPSNWGSQEISAHFYNTTECIKNQPSQYGFLLNVGGDAEVHQIWMEQANGSLHHRGGNRNGWHGSTSGSGYWRTLLDSENVGGYALPIKGGTVLGTLLVDKDLYVGENAVFRTFQAQVGQTIEIRCHLTPNTNEWWNLGQSHSMFGDIYSRRGALNGSDISFKENIKNIVENKDIMLLSENTEYDDTVTLNDLYNYVKNIDIKSFNYKKTEENILGIIANEIPENIFNKIGIINENNERVIFATAQIAMLQGALKEAINKIEELQNEIELIKDGVN